MRTKRLISLMILSVLMLSVVSGRADFTFPSGLKEVGDEAFSGVTAMTGRVVMSDGTILADGTPKEVFRQVEQLRSVGLSVPDTIALLYELRQSGLDVPLDALSTEECAQAILHALRPNAE